jgi:hypothetical protein
MERFKQAMNPVQMRLDVMIDFGLVCETDSKTWNPKTGRLEPRYALTDKGKAATAADHAAVDLEVQRRYRETRELADKILASKTIEEARQHARAALSIGLM